MLSFLKKYAFFAFLFAAFFWEAPYAKADIEKSYHQAEETIAVLRDDSISNPFAEALHAGDEIKLYVFGVDDLTGNFKIDTSGHLTLPLIGEIKAEGLSKRDLEYNITKKLIEGQYYNDPKVTIEVVALQPFFILGEVKNPGSYPFMSDLDVFKAIATAGGYTPRAKKGKVTIIRKVDGKKTKIEAEEMDSIQPGDSIKVDQRFF